MTVQTPRPSHVVCQGRMFSRGARPKEQKERRRSKSKTKIPSLLIPEETPPSPSLNPPQQPPGRRAPSGECIQWEGVVSRSSGRTREWKMKRNPHSLSLSLFSFPFPFEMPGASQTALPNEMRVMRIHHVLFFFSRSCRSSPSTLKVVEVTTAEGGV